MYSILNYIIVGTKEYLCPVRQNDLDVCEEYAEEADPPVSIEFLEAVKQYMESNTSYSILALPQTITSALDFYVNVTTYFDQM